MKPARRAALRTMGRRGAFAWLMARGGVGKIFTGAPLGISAASAIAASSATPILSGCQGPGLARGVVWQLDNAHIDPAGRWDALGVTDLMVQWSAVDGVCFVPAEGHTVPEGCQAAPRFPEWRRIATMPWARRVLMGLAGLSSEPRARAEVSTLAALIQQQQRGNGGMPLAIEGWYFPVEVDPTWKQVSAMRGLLASLPRPLWISVYDQSNIGGAALARWLASWLPDDIGVLFQDGVGVYAREARVARGYADALVGHFGESRVRIIAEAFRPLPASPTVDPHGAASASASASAVTAAGASSAAGTASPSAPPAPLFRAATAEELKPQLLAYQGYRVYLFDGPHYVSNQLVERLLQ
ncbi:hypothetical protein ACQUFY_00105 [Robbsia andropogonis]|uniref:hypothetical protein n=1 Tax=Robbsia andropogonis TaxID=28092 RepID=UPI003D25CB9B